jgi:hypothetical protein
VVFSGRSRYQRQVLGPLSLFTTEKRFTNPWVGNPTANRLGLHIGRILLADALDRVRWALHAPMDGDDSWIATLRNEGVVAIPEFLPRPSFEVLRDEVMGVITDSLKTRPPRSNTAPGFGAKEPFEGGFDRFDGSTLNRHISLAASATPAALSLVQSERFRRLYTSAQGRGFTVNALSLHYLRNGSDETPDPQKDLHRDTFHFTVKCWYFVKSVETHEGPFNYVKGSNRTTRQRLAWEHEQALVGREQGSDGSFRIDESELGRLDLPPPTTFEVDENTLLIADTHGFHRRGAATPGSERFAIYGGMRRSPYFV